MLKKAIQQGHSRWEHRMRTSALRWGCVRGENAASWLFQHPATGPRSTPTGESM